MQPTLVMYDDYKDSFWAIGIDKKEATQAMVKYCVGTIEQSGCSGEHITFKTDQEPGTVAPTLATAASRVREIVPIESPVRASKSNGVNEGAIWTWKGQLRTIQNYVESRLGRHIAV